MFHDLVLDQFLNFLNAEGTAYLGTLLHNIERNGLDIRIGEFVPVVHDRIGLGDSVVNFVDVKSDFLSGTLDDFHCPFLLFLNTIAILHKILLFVKNRAATFGKEEKMPGRRSTLRFFGLL